MSGVAYTQTAADAGGVTVSWPGLTNGAVGVGVSPLPCRSASFEASGVWGSGGSVVIEGSNDNLNWYALSPPALTAAGLFATGSMELPRYFRPHVTAGDGTTAITVTAYLKF